MNNLYSENLITLNLDANSKEEVISIMSDLLKSENRITSITDFIINNYLDNNITLEELQDADYADLYSAIDEDCIELIKEQEEDLER